MHIHHIHTHHVHLGLLNEAWIGDVTRIKHLLRHSVSVQIHHVIAHDICTRLDCHIWCKCHVGIDSHVGVFLHS